MIGSLNKRITLANPVHATGLDGGNEVSYTDFATVWGRYAQKKSEVDGEGAQETMNIKGLVEMRNSSLVASNIQLNTRITIGSSEYFVTGLNSNSRFIAAEVVSNTTGLMASNSLTGEGGALLNTETGDNLVSGV